MEKELEDNITIIAESIENFEQRFDKGESGYYFQRIKEVLYGLKFSKRLDNIKNLFKKSPFGEKKALRFRDEDFKFWREKTKPKKIVCPFSITKGENGIFELDHSKTTEYFEQFSVLVFEDVDVCDDNILVAIKVEGYNQELLLKFLDRKGFLELKRNNFEIKTEDRFKIIKYNFRLNQVENAYLVEKNINRVLFWIDSAIEYLKDDETI